ncbi:TIGR04452 family lipoprotein [Leptospira gomenensis]|uniref:TIGR04452 family lipoprotein n=1 Tax=Leptospira gomenensis TaxID=2484974 RepID=A0A5F1Z476_9LEPT|nr:TIGR04452 family lipoprotein [Leptospira gomenensis]TGK28991.1 TIGR04452 family lipoprotein [Leptospira gomenensis]TGK32814.1 TIGR04452 family lipoprotein [Leptospira gomenensis]TGK40750.1 TIGR04452 family lipoprotein [Leptospira gomenensis]TGK68406.1 TIGR04452 family lipoprotein [Leptospira gomenensis]
MEIRGIFARILFLSGSFYFHHCAYLNVNEGLVSGTEAKAIISDRLLLNQTIYLIGSTQPEPIRSNAVVGLGITILTPDLIGIDEKNMYQKEAVEECADQIFFVSLISTPLSAFVCKATDPPLSIPLISRKL